MTAAEILSEAGWQPMPGWAAYQRGSAVGGIDPGGTARWKVIDMIPDGHPLYGPDTPDTHEEAAAWLVAHAKALGVRTVTVGVGAAPADAAPAVASERTQGRPESEPELVVALAPDSVPVSVVRGDLIAPRKTPGAEDAEYESLVDLTALPAPTPPPVEGPGELLAIGEEIKDFAPDENVDAGIAQFIFGDNLALDRLVRQGQVATRSAELIEEARAVSRFDLAEFTALQSYVVSNLDAAGGFTGDGARYARFVELSDVQGVIRNVEGERDAKIDFLRTAGREAVACFDPLAGWPEF